MFPKLDGDLRIVTTHFRFDNLATADTLCENPNANELKTPLQNAKQFIVETAADEDDDEATLSSDCFAMQQTSDGVVSTATKLLEDIINNSAPKKQQTSEPFADTTIFKRAHTANPSVHLQKQISLNACESASAGTPAGTAQRTPRRNYEYSRFISVDQRSISDTEDNVANEFGSINKKGTSKTQSCQTLSCAAPRSPGAILVKEKFIEFPKHVAHRTSSLGYVESTDNTIAKTIPASSESMSKLMTRKNSTTKPRFTTTKVDESQLGPSVLKETWNIAKNEQQQRINMMHVEIQTISSKIENKYVML